MKFHLVLILVALLPFSIGRKFEKCELAREMYDVGYSKESLPDWMCLVQSESSYNSSAIGGPNSNGSFDWGLFQINDGYWCATEGVGNDCNINCWDLVDDDLNDDFACIELIFARHGFTAWNAWKAKCQDGLEDFSVESCF